MNILLIYEKHIGGVNSIALINEIIAIDNVNGVAIGNVLNYNEHCYQKIKNSLNSPYLRPSNLNLKS